MEKRASTQMGVQLGIGAMTCVVMTERQRVGDFVGQVSVIWTRERAFGLPSDIDGEALHQGD